MANKKIDIEYEPMRKAGNTFLKDTINELNKNGDFDILNSEGYAKFQEFYLQYEGNKKMSEASTAYMFINYAITSLHNLYVSGINDFDRQSLKLSNLTNDMYIIERDINKIIFYQNKRTEIRKFIELEDKSNESMDMIIETLIKMNKEGVENAEKINKGIQQLQELQTASKQIVSEEKQYLAKNKVDITNLRKRIDSITNMETNKDFLGLLQITFRSFATITSIELMLEAIYSLFNLKIKLDIKSPYDLTSYMSTRSRIGDLLELAFENESISESFEDSKLFYLLTDYIDLKERMEHLAMKNVLEKQKNLLKQKIELFIDLIEDETMGDIDKHIKETIITSKNTIEAEMRW